MATARIVAWWALWLMAGAALVLGAVSLPFLLVVPVVAALVTAPLAGKRHALVAGPIGAAAALLFIADLNRGPDGSTCTTEGNTTTCSETLNALPWFVLAVLAMAIAAAVALRGRDPSHP